MRTPTTVAVTLAALLLATTARAQPGATPLAEAAPPARSESTALALALGSTAVGFGMFSMASQGGSGHYDSALALGGLGLIVVGPSAGHIYAGEGMHALGFSALRLGSLVVFGLGVLSSLDLCDADGPCTGSPSNGQPNSGARALLAAGALGYVSLTIYDLHDSLGAARRASARALTVRPAPLRTPGGRTAPGLVVAGTF